MYCIRITDVEHKEVSYLSYTDEIGSPFYYLLSRTNYNKCYSSTDKICKYNTKQDALDFINKIKQSINEMKFNKVETDFIKELPLTLMIRDTYKYDIMDEKYL